MKHIYSGSYITLQPELLARQVGSVRVGLKDVDTDYSSLKILPSSRIKKIGDVVSYSDAVVLANCKEDHYYLHVSEFLGYYDQGLEINGSEMKTEWKPKLFASDQKDSSIFSNQNIVTSGSVLMIFNRHIGGYLSTSPKVLSEISNIK